MPGDELNIYTLWGLRVVLLLLLVASPFTPSSVSLTLNNSIVRFLVVIAIVLLIFVDSISAVVFVALFIVLFMLSRKKQVQFSETPSEVEINEYVEEAIMVNGGSTPSDESTAQHSSNAFTTPFQFHDVQSNLVGDETVQNTEVRTWDNELGPQGMGEIKGYNYFQ
jgi:hypothetical protein